MSKFLVGIDAGHGMHTFGKETVPMSEDLYINGKLVRAKGKRIKENEWNRGVSEYLAKALIRCGINYIYLADMSGATDTTLDRRAAKANINNCDIVISNHYNAIGSCSKWQTKAHGLLVIRTKNCSDNTIKLGKLVESQLKSDINYSYSYGLMKDVDISGFTLAILRQTEMPSILIEYGFMDYEKEAKLMLDKSYQKKCAESVCKAVCKYFNVAYIKAGSTPVATTSKKKYIKNICDEELNIRAIADWNGKVINTLKPGDCLTLKEGPLTAKNGSTKMYKTILDTYITASDKYVKIIEK